MNQHLESSDGPLVGSGAHRRHASQKSFGAASTGAAGAGANAAGPERHSTIVPGITLLILGVVAAVMSLNLGLSKDGLPGPGLWPLLASILMLVTAALVLIGPQHRHCEPLTRSEVAQTAPAVGVLVAFVALLPAVGVVSTCSLTGFAWLRFVAREGWRLSLILPPALGFAIYLIFVVMLQVPMPIDAFLPR